MQWFRTIVSLQLIIFDLYHQATCAAALNYIMKAVLGGSMRVCYLGKVKVSWEASQACFDSRAACVYFCVRNQTVWMLKPDLQGSSLLRFQTSLSSAAGLPLNTLV